jgi:uncharacterized damage-inducible protein DinB
MSNPRTDALVAKLERGLQKTLDFFTRLTPEQWQEILYQEPIWQVRHLLAHFVSSEKHLLALVQSIVAGGPGAPLEMDIDRFNAGEQARLESQTASSLLEMLQLARQETIEWVKTLDESQLDRRGRHPVLGEASVETIIESIYGHQLLHMRDLMRLINTK